MSDWNYKGRINFEAYGVSVGVTVNDERAIDKIKEILPVRSRLLAEDAPTAHNFTLVWGEDSAKEDVLYQESEEISRRVDAQRLVAVLDTYMRMTIGECAPHHIFLHAGVVSWNGEALIFPAKSYSGKTSLVAELI